ncbi:Transcription termination protein NusA [hydrothermal vent metagenome]|uniref:Transcription termination protein NusA n=1 Tax=hydrothermal vent metagenome TaxID=652676 RepID=A0A3B0V1S5_9ZZZZ
MFANLVQIIEQVEKDKGIDKDVLIEALESALLKAAEKRFGAGKEIEAHYDEELGEIELFVFKEVVEEVEDSDLQISLKDGVELDPEAQIGDSLGVKLNANEFGRIDAQTAKQIIIQKIREAERDIVFKEYSEKQGEIITGIVQRFERGDMIVDLGRTEALLPKREQVRRESYRQGERVRGMVLEVRGEAKGPQVVISRTHPGFLVKLFQMEVPEIYEGIVEIKGAAREPGERAKIAVSSNNMDVDPVGACVGVKGSRVQAVVQELKGEKIDIIHWADESAVLAKNALSPAQITKVVVDDEEHSMEVIVPDDQLSLAIGKKGQNVRLAAKLTGWKIDIHTETENTDGPVETLSPDEALTREVKAAAVKEAEESRLCEGLSVIAGIDEALSTTLVEAGYDTVGSLIEVLSSVLTELEGMDEERAEAIQAAAREFAGAPAE